MSFDSMNESIYDVIKHGDIEDLAYILGKLFPYCRDCPLDTQCETGCVETWKDFLNMSPDDFRQWAALYNIKNYCEGQCDDAWMDAFFISYKNWMDIINGYR